ncbi:MAG: tRNA epoxyqueuosine(34) reductase QueG [Candidatus Marinimicrobia bacterium]|nr:tRNA epoxyqueuosine(34) reductase QueG [Candidatus Neomarinimicrobiota bacterium]
MNKTEFTNNIKEVSYDVGFDLIGITSPNTNNFTSNIFFQEWLDRGNHASMKWLDNKKEERKNIFKYFPGVKSVLSFGLNYYSGDNASNNNYKISNYAWGDDYHIVVKQKLYEVLSFIKSYNENINYRVCVDTSPIMEKNWAQKAGLGWIGKHTNLINRKKGSWFFLGEILIDINLSYDEPFIDDLCGTCVKCIEACPTEALSPYLLDSNKCLSYLTIEHRGKIHEDYSDKLEGWIYGCDICQEVCPWNITFSELSNEKSFYKKKEIQSMKDSDWEKIDKEQYRKIFKKSAVKRTKYEGLIRNIKLNKK